MPDLKTIQSEIRARRDEVQTLLEPLREEAEQLTKLVSQLQGERAPAPAASTRSRRRAGGARPARATSTAAARRGRAAGDGNRAQQAVATIAARPGITASELAASMGINPNYLYRVLPRLEREAKVTKRGRGYHPAGDGAGAATDGDRVTP